MEIWHLRTFFERQHLSQGFHNMNRNFKTIFFDLETSGLGDGAEIIQIGAYDANEHYGFKRYILPRKGISPYTTDHNGFEVVDNSLFQHGKYRRTTGLKKAFIDLIEFLEGWNIPIILVGHNAFNFDCRFLFKGLKASGMIDEFSSVVQGFADSLPLFKQYLPGLDSYALPNVHYTIIGEEFAAHDALEDSVALANIFESERLDKNKIWRSAKSFDSLLDIDNARLAAKQRYWTLVDLKEYGVSMGMLWRMAHAGLTMPKLTNILYNNGTEGLYDFLSQIMDDGHPRITRNGRVLSDICDGVAANL